jgi:Transcription termination and cleavage factor C-terminal
VRCVAALLAQIMSLTPEQIELLPAEQKAQVIALQAQMVRARNMMFWSTIEASYAIHGMASG